MPNPTETCKNLAVAHGLTLIHEKYTPERGERFTLYLGHTRLFGADTIAPIEYYLYGFRDGRTAPSQQAHEAMDYLTDSISGIEAIARAVTSHVSKLKEVEKYIEPATRER